MSATPIDLGVCYPRPLRDPSLRAAVRAYRQTYAFSFTMVVTDDTARPQVPTPIEAFAVAFGLGPDPRIIERVNMLFAAEAFSIMNNTDEDDAGYIYVFHDAADPPNVLKIGRTRRDPRRRIAEWERELAPQQGRSVRLLAAYPTLANEFAERIVHEILRCHRIANRVNPVTNDELEEFFLVENFLALKLFIRESLRCIDRDVRRWREQRRRRAGTE